MTMQKKNEINIKQLPVLEYDALFKETKEEINKAIQFTKKDFIVTKENKIEIKESRTSLRNKKTELKDQFKAVKEKVFGPWNDFEKKFNEELINPLTEAEQKVKVKVDEIEDTDKKEMREESEGYFKEYIKQMELENDEWGLDLQFINFDMIDFNITLSTSKKKLREVPQAFVDMVVNNMRTISVMQESARFYAEYKKLIKETNPKEMNKLLDNALLNVNKMLKVEEEEKKKADELEMERIRKENEEKRNEAIKGTSFAEPLATPIEETVPSPSKTETPVSYGSGVRSGIDSSSKEDATNVNETLYTMKFEVKNCTLEKAKKLKIYLEEGEYEYDSIK